MSGDFPRVFEDMHWDHSQQRTQCGRAKEALIYGSQMWLETLNRPKDLHLE